jgi:leucyl aminopeptidase
MTVTLKKPTPACIPVHLTDRDHLATHTAGLPAAQRQWLATVGFTGAPDTHALLPDDHGRLQAVWAGVRAAAHPYALSALPKALPAGRYALGDGGFSADAGAAALSWALGGYTFSRYKPARRAPAELLLPASGAARQAIAHTRDLVNTPAEHMGPAELAAAAGRGQGSMARSSSQTVGDALLKAGFPAIHAVGRAADARAPRLIELTWGKPKDPKLVLVGKGVCFDSGGLDIKGARGHAPDEEGHGRRRQRAGPGQRW